MLLKLSVLLFTIGACCVTMLVARHMRIQAEHELAATHLRIVEMDSRLIQLRAEIAERLIPENVHAMSRALGIGEPALNPGPATGDGHRPATHSRP